MQAHWRAILEGKVNKYVEHRFPVIQALLHAKLFNEQWIIIECKKCKRGLQL